MLIEKHLKFILKENHRHLAFDKEESCNSFTVINNPLCFGFSKVIEAQGLSSILVKGYVVQAATRLKIALAMFFQ